MNVPRILAQRLAVQARGAATAAAGGSARRMKYPYTYSAKIAQFPYKFYYETSWFVKYYPIGFLVSMYFFYKIHRLANSPENKANAEAARKKEAEAHGHH